MARSDLPAPTKFGFGELQEARFANEALEAERTGLGYLRVRPRSGRASPTVTTMRVAPGVTRQFEAGPEGLELLAAGASHENDGELITGWWSD